MAFYELKLLDKDHKVIWQDSILFENKEQAKQYALDKAYIEYKGIACIMKVKRES